MFLCAFMTILSQVVPAFSDEFYQEPSQFEPLLVFMALRSAYGDLVEDMGWEEGELFFSIRGRTVFFKGGRMLFTAHLPQYARYDPVLYRYVAGPLISIPRPVPYPYNRSNDLLVALIGETQREIVASCRWVPFLDHRVFVHEICAGALQRIESRLYAISRSSPEVRAYINDIRIVFSRDGRKVDGTDNLSYHAYGLALDIVPRDYRGKQVYWRWSSVWNSSWERMPLSERWQPPQRVIEVFEENGFIWGGKWYHFDTIHFEYRPEILILNRLQFGEASVKE